MDAEDLGNKQIKELRRIAQDLQVAYSHKGRLINKPELIKNIKVFLETGKTEKRGRPKYLAK